MSLGTFLYFAFGSNLCSQRIRLKNPSAISKGPALLLRHRLKFQFHSQRWHGAPATIVPDDSGKVYGVLWELKMEDLCTLDEQEGANQSPPIYKRCKVKIHPVKENSLYEDSIHSTVEAFTYHLSSEVLASCGGGIQRPSKPYKNVIIRGAIEHGLPKDYIEKLQQIEDNGYDGPVEVSLPLDFKPHPCK